MTHLKKVLGSVLAAALVPLTLTATSNSAFAADTPLAGTESPALVSTNPHPQIVNGRTVPLDPRPGFRVLPYLQRPSTHGMTINWFTELGNEATLTLTGPGLPSEGLVQKVQGIRNPVNSYQDYELTQGDLSRGKELSTPQGTWIRADNPYKYSVDLEDLTEESTYNYTVEVDGYAHSASFTTLPSAGAGITKPLHIIAFSDTETDPIGRVTYREWEQTLDLAEGSEERPGKSSAWDQKFGGSKRNGRYAVNYALTEDMAQEINNRYIKAANPDLILLPGDITERGSSQSHWDEWFRYFAGDKGHILDTRPLITSLGNHEVYGYGTPDDRTSVIRARAAYNQAFDTHGSDNPDHRDAYHRTDFGPVTVISLDSTNGEPDQDPKTMPAGAAMSGNDANITPEQYGSDTQNQFTMAEIRRDFPKAVAAGWWGPNADPNSVDQPNFMPGSQQYLWLEKQLKDARAKGQTIIIQYHHVAYSNGTHGTTMGHRYSDMQPGTPMRHLEPLFEQYDVAAVFSGHDEMFQASWVDEDRNGKGIYHWDVGVASDGLRGEKMVKSADGTMVPLRFNTHSVWMAQANEPEKWVTNSAGVKHLVSGGKHYGHLDIKIAPYTGPRLDSGAMPAASMVMTPVSIFPILDDNYNLVSTERREMLSGQFTVYLDSTGKTLPGSPVVENNEGTDRFSMAVLPDTQFYARYGSPEADGDVYTPLYGSRPYESQTKWIAENQDKYGIKMAMHLGDIVDRVNKEGEWRLADSAMKILEDAKVPYSILAGNHDVGRTAEEEGLSSDYTIFKNWFPAERAAKNSSFVERDPSGAHEYHILDVKGSRFLVLNLSWGADDAALAWAQGVLDKYPTTPTILNSHQLINVASDGHTPAPTHFGEKVWNRLIKANNQVFLTFNGHHHGATKWEHTNDFGNPVHQVLMDYQMAYMGGNGYMGLVEFDLGAGRITQTSFSPWVMLKPEETRSGEDRAKLTEAGQSFSIDFNFRERFPDLKIGESTAAASATEALNEWLSTYAEPKQTRSDVPTSTEDFPHVDSTAAHWRPQMVDGKLSFVDISKQGNDMEFFPGEGSGTAVLKTGQEASHHYSAADSSVLFTPETREKFAYFQTLEGAPINSNEFREGYTIEAIFALTPGSVNETQTLLNRYVGALEENDGSARLSISNLNEVQWKSAGHADVEGWSNWSGEIFKDNSFYHVAVVNDPADHSVKVYINGNLILRNRQGEIHDGISLGYPSKGEAPWRIGGAQNLDGTPRHGFWGAISEIRVVAKPLGQDQWLTARGTGSYEPSQPSVSSQQHRGVFYSHAWGKSGVDRIANYGRAGDELFFGDWDGDGVDTPMVRRGKSFLGTNKVSGAAEFEFTYGREEDSVLVGDWDGDGRDSIAVVRGNRVFINNDNEGGPASSTLFYGRVDDTLFAGDFDGNGHDELAAKRGNTFFIQSNLNESFAEKTVSYGRASDTVFVGDWDGDGRDTLGVLRGNQYFLRNSLTGGPAELIHHFGRDTDPAYVGDWTGKGVDTPAVVRR